MDWSYSKVPISNINIITSAYMTEPVSLKMVKSISNQKARKGNGRKVYLITRTVPSRSMIQMGNRIVVHPAYLDSINKMIGENIREQIDRDLFIGHTLW